MATRGPYKKGLAKRAEILDTALEVIQRNGYSNATVKELAEAVGLSQNGLLHYFGSKDRLFVEVLRHRDEQLAIEIGQDPHELIGDFGSRVTRAAEATAEAPGVLQLTLRMSVEATESDHPAHDFFARRYDEVREISAAALAEMKESGATSADLDARIAATLLYAAIEGLQVQWSYDPSIDMSAHLAYLLRCLGVGTT